MMGLNEVVKNIRYGYIFGAGIVARKFYYSILETYRDKIKGFVVSRLDNNPVEIDGKSVYAISEDDLDIEATVLLTVSEAYHPEVYESLKKRGFKNVISVLRFYGLESEEEAPETNGDNVIVADYIDDKVELNDDLKRFRKQFIKEHISKSHAFGGHNFYQSLPILGIKGMRLSDYRIDVYHLDRYINDTFEVLDIGSNLGFLDIEISRRVKHVTGLEYNKFLVKRGIQVAEALNINNVEFVCADYNEWVINNSKSFDMILSFAVHFWLDIFPLVYAEQLKKMLKPNGYLIFESQDYKNDNKFLEFVKTFVEEGFKIIEEGMSKDVDNTARKFVVFQNAVQ